jgi:AmmeMemoRadiSam system protein B
MTAIPDVRPSRIAGAWYEGDPTRLADQVDQYIRQASLPPLLGEVIGLVAPHAGHIYSGRTAGHAFRVVQGLSYDLVAILSPLHGFHPAGLLTSAHRAYATPLGLVSIDQEAVAAFEQILIQAGGPALARLTHDNEHSLEIELPFLQRALQGPFKLLPLMLRTRTPASLMAAGAALSAVLKGRRALLVASTDLSHFFPQEQAIALDHFMLAQIAALAPQSVLQAEVQEKGFACGAPAVAAMLWAALGLGANSVQVLHHSTSAEQTHDYSQVVGYGAAAVTKN